MTTTDSAFIAQGGLPAFGNFYPVGFDAKGSKPAKPFKVGTLGVGEEAGVYGATADVVVLPPTVKLRDSAGVWGASVSSAGVAGSSTDAPGVRGKSDNSSGVSGQSGAVGPAIPDPNLPDVAAVFGSSDTQPGVIGTSRAQVGVYGYSNDRAGVTGRSDNDDGVSGQSGAAGPTIPDPNLPNIAAVFGSSDKQPGVIGTSRAQVGVYGYSNDTAGVTGHSTNGNGVSGQSGAAGPALPDPNLPDIAAVFGSSDTQPGVIGTSRTQAGVYGYSIDKAGVEGISSANPGVTGSSGVFGVFGSSNAGTGVHGYSYSYVGVGGVSTNGVGVSGWSPNGDAIHGNSDKRSGVVGTSGVTGPSIPNSTNTAGVIGSSDQQIGVIGTSNKAAGVVGFSNNVGVFGVSGTQGPDIAQGTAVGKNIIPPVGGVFGTADKHPGVIGASNAAIGVYGFSTGNSGVVGESVGSWAGYFAGNVVVTGQIFAGIKDAIVPFPDGSKRVLHCMESPEHWFEDFGAGKLKRGRAVVKLDGDFAKVIKRGDYHVFLTPRGDCRGLYVRRQGSTSFEVRELAAGTSSVAFSYRIVGRRKDIKGHRRFAKIDTRLSLPRARPTRTARRMKIPGPTPAELRAVAARMEKEVRAQMRKLGRKGKRSAR
jgi:hypothetical protein